MRSAECEIDGVEDDQQQDSELHQRKGPDKNRAKGHRREDEKKNQEQLDQTIHHKHPIKLKVQLSTFRFDLTFLYHFSALKSQRNIVKKPVIPAPVLTGVSSIRSPFLFRFWIPVFPRIKYGGNDEHRRNLF
jgi:hypothetical protein